MLKKAMLAMAALAVSAAFLGAGSASAAILYKDATKIPKVLVPVGATFTAAQPFWNGEEKTLTPDKVWEFSNGASALNICTNSSITFKVTQNSGGTVKAVPTAANFPKYPNCGAPQKWLSAPEGQELSVTGSSIVNGTETAWLGTKFNFAWETVGLGWFGAFTGATGSPPTKGVFVQQPTAAKSPISLNLVKAPLSLGSMYNVTAKFILTGEAATWSFG